MCVSFRFMLRLLKNEGLLVSIILDCQFVMLDSYNQMYFLHLMDSPMYLTRKDKMKARHSKFFCVKFNKKRFHYLE